MLDKTKTNVNFKQYPNIYNMALLLATGYEVEKIVAPLPNEKSVTVVLTKPNAIVTTSTHRERPLIALSVFANNEFQLEKDTEKTLVNLNVSILSDKSTLKPKTKDAISNLIHLQGKGNFINRLKSGAYAHNVERTFETIKSHGNGDVALNLNRMQGVTSLLSAVEDYIEDFKVQEATKVKKGSKAYEVKLNTVDESLAIKNAEPIGYDKLVESVEFTKGLIKGAEQNLNASSDAVLTHGK